MSKIPQLDVYSHMQVPFNVAAFCRQRKFHPQAHRLAAAIKALETSKAAVLQAEMALDNAETALLSTVAETEAWIAASGG